MKISFALRVLIKYRLFGNKTFFNYGPLGFRIFTNKAFELEKMRIFRKFEEIPSQK